MRILLIGNGSIGKKHIHNLIEMGISDIDICDPLTDGAKYKNFQDIGCNDGRYDLVIVSTPTKEHLHQLHCLNDWGYKYIVIEKTLCTLHTEYEILIENGMGVRVKELKSDVFVNNAYRFENGIKRLKELLPRAGKIRYVNMENAYSFTKLHPQYKWEDYDGIIYDDSHIINTSRFLFGDPEEIKFKMIRKDRCVFMWESEKGIEVFHDTNILNEVYKKRIEVVGELGNLVYNFGAHHIYFCPANESDRIAFAYDHQSNLFEALKYVIEVVKKGGRFEENTIDDSVKDMLVIKELIK